MAGGSSHERGGIISGINVTPLVDITLVLLIIFIVTAKIVVAPAVPLDLPKSGSGEEVQVVFSVLLPRDGRILINGSAVANLTELQARARSARSDSPDLRAVIQADGEVSHRNVMAALDALKVAGVTKIAFGVVPEAGP